MEGQLTVELVHLAVTVQMIRSVMAEPVAEAAMEEQAPEPVSEPGAAQAEPAELVELAQALTKVRAVPVEMAVKPVAMVPVLQLLEQYILLLI